MKKMTAISLSLFMLISLSSFFGFLFGNGPSPKRKMAYKITQELSKKYKAKYDLNFMGISEAAPEGKYQTIGLETSIYKVLSKDEGRILLVNCAKDALEAFNSYPGFEEHIANVPFTGKNIIVNIYVHPPNIADVYHPDIAVFTFYNNKLEYKTESPTHVATLKQMYYTEEEETLEEAIKIIEAQQGRAGLPGLNV